MLMEKIDYERDISIAYQPIMNLNEDSIFGYEALCRVSYAGETLNTEEFINYAEKTGTIEKVGEVICSKIVKDIQHPQFDGKVVFINLSKLQLHNTLTLIALLAIIRAERISTSKIGFEITESLPFETIDYCNIVFLRRFGYLVALDDFGKDNHVPEFLNDTQYDILKLDRDLLSLNKEELETMCERARQISNIVLCEGIETAEHRDLAKELECQLGQGYFYAKPEKLEKE